MEISRKAKVNVVETLKKAVNGRDDFHFYVDELTPNNYMPTYAGQADEKYAFERMDDDFFAFLDEKINKNGVYIRLILATCNMTCDGAVFTLECGSEVKTFTAGDCEIAPFEFADYGIKVASDEVILGTTADGGSIHIPYFAVFSPAEGEYASLKNPLNRFVCDLLWQMIVFKD